MVYNGKRAATGALDENKGAWGMINSRVYGEEGRGKRKSKPRRESKNCRGGSV